METHPISDDLNTEKKLYSEIFSELQIRFINILKKIKSVKGIKYLIGWAIVFAIGNIIFNMINFFNSEILNFSVIGLIFPNIVILILITIPLLVKTVKERKFILKIIFFFIMESSIMAICMLVLILSDLNMYVFLQFSLPIFILELIVAHIFFKNLKVKVDSIKDIVKQYIAEENKESDLEKIMELYPTRDEITIVKDKLKDLIEHLKQKDNYNREIINLTANPIIAFDMSAKITDISNSILNITGFNPEYYIGKSIKILFKYEKYYNEFMEEVFSDNSYFTNPVPRRFEIASYNKKDENLDLLFEIMPTSKELGFFTGFISSLSDFTALKNLINSTKVITSDVSTISSYIATNSDEINESMKKMAQGNENLNTKSQRVYQIIDEVTGGLLEVKNISKKTKDDSVKVAGDSKRGMNIAKVAEELTKGLLNMIEEINSNTIEITDVIVTLQEKTKNIHKTTGLISN
ncbi:MAG: hypothetical protein ACTSWY_04460, partial [Promethearchaeota archaeon]